MVARTRSRSRRKLALLELPAELQARVDANEEWAKAFDTNLGPFQKKYEAMTEDMSHLYADAKKKHATALAACGLGGDDLTCVQGFFKIMMGTNLIKDA